ncbi:hypothetical protein J8J14_22180 [Roseomonas sp. SSH11]|uniref:Flagellar protein FlgN n=1 Tax=Pararoseomonas baculiformis TaxID=2820812 RepID=A0ABS4ALT4_9PROT|nr:hypothetical protein [Pararoseomonas baculiformis]MBP0447473.1 hypothetical protein [Pararoseomonas baculiformis]
MSGLDDLEHCVVALTEVMAAETRALKAHDVAAAVALAQDKRAAVDAFLAARVGLSGEELRPIAAQLAVAVDRLREGVRDNRLLLEQAMAVQGRVIETLARAATRSTQSAVSYGRSVGASSPLAISVRA